MKISWNSASPGPRRSLTALGAALRPHLGALLLIAIVAAAWTWHAWLVGVEYLRTSDTTGVFYGAVVDVERSGGPMPRAARSGREGAVAVLASVGEALAAGKLPDLYQKAFDTYLQAVYRESGDVMLAYRVWVFPLNFIFTAGAYLLFLGIVRRRVWALALAVGASLPVFLAVAGENFGIGPVIHYSRRHFMTAFVPWLFWAYLQVRAQARPGGMVVLFFLIGLVSNLHASGLLLGEIVLLAWLAERRSFVRDLPVAAACGLALAVGGVFAFGGLWAAFANTAVAVFASLFASAHAAAGTVGKTIPANLTYLFYPLTTYAAWPLLLQHALALAVTAVACLGLWLRTAPALAPMAALLVLAFLGGVDLLRFYPLLLFLLWLARRNLADSGLAATSRLMLSTYLVSFVGMLIFEWLYFNVESAPLVYNQLRGARFLGLLVWLLLAFLLAKIDWRALRRAERIALCLLLAALAVVELRGVYRDNLRVTDEMRESRQMRELGAWARQNLPKGEKVFVFSSIFGIASGMEVAGLDKDRRREIRGPLIGMQADTLPAAGLGFAFAVVKEGEWSGVGAKVLAASGPYRLVRISGQAD